MKKIDGIIIHHSASSFGDADMIDGWHKERGWRGIGYHFVILNGYRTFKAKKSKMMDCIVGQIERGRIIDEDQWMESNEIGSHALGLNSSTIGVCMIHNVDDEYQSMQLHSLQMLVSGLMDVYGVPITSVKGHSEVDKKKPYCPDINMDWLREQILNMHKLGEQPRQYALNAIRGLN